MKYTLAIFDLDGTILNTLEDLYSSVNYVLLKSNFPTRSIDEIRSFLGNGAYNLIQKSVPDNCNEQKLKEIFDQYIEYYGSHSNIKTAPYNGITKLIKKLRSNHVKIAVISNKQNSDVKKLCEIHFDGLIDYVTGERENTPKKPDPTSVIETINKFKVNPNEVVFIGDSEVDILTSKNAGIDSIAVTWGFRNEIDLKSSSPTYFAHSSDDIFNIMS